MNKRKILYKIRYIALVNNKAFFTPSDQILPSLLFFIQENKTNSKIYCQYRKRLKTGQILYEFEPLILNLKVQKVKIDTNHYLVN